MLQRFKGTGVTLGKELVAMETMCLVNYILRLARHPPTGSHQSRSKNQLAQPTIEKRFLCQPRESLKNTIGIFVCAVT